MRAFLVVRGFGNRVEIPCEVMPLLQQMFGVVRAERILAGNDRNYGVLMGV
jgi:hypothetical protein